MRPKSPAISHRRRRFDAENVLKRHVHNRHRDQRLDQGREPRTRGSQVVDRAEQRDRVADSERRDDPQDLPNASHGDEQTQQERAGGRCR